MKIFIFAMLFSFLSNCNGVNKKPDSLERNTITYVESDKDFANPERGFYRASIVKSKNYAVLSIDSLKNYRKNTFSNGSSYKTYNSLVFRYFLLGDFIDRPISQNYIENMKKDFEAARKAGVKLIPRFAYTVSPIPGDCPEKSFCPPYGDAPKEIVLQHIEQLSPVLTNNADVIFTIQMGFIGIWGENYYTDYFGDASSNGDQGKLFDKNWKDRIEVLNTLLDATPPEIMVQVRYPQIKQRAIYGVNGKTNVKPVTKKEAYNGSHKSRIGFHNDCLLASEDGLGTYEDYGNSSSPRRTDIANLKSYFEEDSKYVIVGGETCSDSYSPENDCAPAGIADIDLRALHYSYLNADYNNKVNNDWVDGGCMEEIKKNLGYRLVLDSAILPYTTKASEKIKINLNLRNVGYTAPVKKRPVFLVLKEVNGNDKVNFPIDTDIRFWNDNIKLQSTINFPKNLKSGNYSLYLFMPDGNQSIAHRSEYAIRLANENMWEEETGYNNLNHTIKIN